jgi:hypothetical protein
MSVESHFPGLVAVTAVPSLALIVTRHPVLGTLLMTAAAAAWVLHAGLEARARRAWHRELLNYAQTSTALGNDPGPVVTALGPRPPVDEHDDELFRPGRDDPGWTHLQPNNWDDEE